jgi:hypothetical protein
MKKILIFLGVVALFLLALVASGSSAQAGVADYKMERVVLKAGQMMPGGVPKILVISGHKVDVGVDDDYSLTMESEIWVLRGPDILSGTAMAFRWEAYHNGIKLPVGSLGWLLSSKLINGACGSTPPPSGGGGGQPQPQPQPPASGGTGCKGNESNPMNPDNNPQVTLPAGWYTAEEWKTDQPWHHMFALKSDGSKVVDAREHVRVWHNLSDREECAKAEAKRAATSMKHENPSWTVFGPDGEEIQNN